MQQADVGDGYCDPIYNTLECEWDGGDCCVDTCQDGLYPCGEMHAYACKDPSQADHPSAAPTAPPTHAPSTLSGDGLGSFYAAASLIMALTVIAAITLACCYCKNEKDVDDDGGFGKSSSGKSTKSGGSSSVSSSGLSGWSLPSFGGSKRGADATARATELARFERMSQSSSAYPSYKPVEPRGGSAKRGDVTMNPFLMDRGL